MTATMAQYGRNSFMNALRSIFDENPIKNIINRYRLGTTQAGAVVFWQIDTLGRVRYGKAIHYLSSLRRDKSKYPVGVHSLIGRREFSHRQCFFGEHLLAVPENSNRTVAIVEAEKTACICSEVIPDYVWLATGGKNGVKWSEKNAWTSLKGRKVMLFPDVDAHGDWVKLLPAFRSFGVCIDVCDFLMNVSHGSQDDIADFLMCGDAKTGGSTDVIISRDNPAVAAMVARNPALSRLMEKFDCETVRTEKIKTQPDIIPQNLPAYQTCSLRPV